MQLLPRQPSDLGRMVLDAWRPTHTHLLLECLVFPSAPPSGWIHTHALPEGQILLHGNEDVSAVPAVSPAAFHAGRPSGHSVSLKLLMWPCSDALHAEEVG